MKSRNISLVWRALALTLACTWGTCASAAPSHTVTFDSVAPTLLLDGDAFEHDGFLFTSAFIGDPADAGGLVGAVVDGADAGVCAGITCPVNDSTHFLAALNDGLLIMESSDGSPFHLAGFDAGAIGNSLLGDPFISDVLLVTGFHADLSSVGEYYAVVTPAIGFQRFVTSTAFAADDFIALSFFSYHCNDAGMCDAFDSNKAQFGLDNIIVTPLAAAVPEPDGVAMLLLGLTSMGALLARRRRAAANRLGGVQS